MSGFYVSPDHYDPLTRHTPVVNEDLHFWAEVMLPSGDWLILEPTPGYDVLGPNLHWSERLLAAMVSACWWLWDHVAAVSLCGCFLFILTWKHLELLDAGAMLVWRVFIGRSWRTCVSRTVRLLECADGASASHAPFRKRRQLGCATPCAGEAATCLHSTGWRSWPSGAATRPLLLRRGGLLKCAKYAERQSANGQSDVFGERHRNASKTC